MGDRGVFTKILAIVGTGLVWLPTLAPFFFSAARLLAGRIFRFDYLMPAELFLLALVGGLFLIWAALRAHSQRGIIVWGLGIAVAAVVASQLLAVVTGLASGETEPVGWQWALVLGMILGYNLALVVTGIGGLRLLRDLLWRSQPPTTPTEASENEQSTS